MSASSSVYPLTATENLAVIVSVRIPGMTIELTLGDLLGQLDSLRDLVGRWLDGALNSSVCVGTECQLA